MARKNTVTRSAGAGSARGGESRTALSKAPAHGHVRKAEAPPPPVCDLKPTVKARIFKKACDLFYREGIHAIGVDTIAAEAGSNKMSLYRSFGSKDELVAEYLREQERMHWEWWDGVIAPHAGNPRLQLEALFEAYASRSHVSKESFGCALANAAVEIREPEHPARAVILGYKGEIRRRLRELAAAIPVAEPQALGDALTMLIEGGAMSTLTFGCKNSPLDHVDKAAKGLIAAFATA